jgi:hypothetical protein
VIVKLLARPGNEQKAAEYSKMVERCLSQMKSETTVEEPPTEVEPDSRSALADALRVLGYPLRRRRALLFLSDATGARLAEDVALSAPDEALGLLSDRILERTGKREGSGDGKDGSEDLAWILQSSCLEVLGELLESQRMTPELEAVLVRHAGQVGRHASSLERTVQEAGNVEDLERLLVEENFFFLDDSSPSARARALDWLDTRGLAPEGFDLLAPTKERRAAIEAALQKIGQPDTTEGEEP